MPIGSLSQKRDKSERTKRAISQGLCCGAFPVEHVGQAQRIDLPLTWKARGGNQAKSRGGAMTATGKYRVCMVPWPGVFDRCPHSFSADGAGGKGCMGLWDAINSPHLESGLGGEGFAEHFWVSGYSLCGPRTSGQIPCIEACRRNQGFESSGSKGDGRTPEWVLFWLVGCGSGFFGVIQVAKRW